MKVEGLVVKAYSNFFDVMLLERAGEYFSKGRILEAQLPGRFREEETSVLTGDRVEVNVTIGEGTVTSAIIQSVRPRSSQLTRPPIANVSQVILVFTLVEPEFNWSLLDRQLVLAEAQELPVVLCCNKADLLESLQQLRPICRLYSDLGYTVVVTSACTGKGIVKLEELLTNSISVFAGQSGVGKSRLINCLDEEFQLELGEVSRKQGRGRHTTRQVQLLPLNNDGWVADTPGFNFLEVSELVPKEELTFCFPEMEELLPECRFANCLHDKEPGCAVKAAVEDGTVHTKRYQHYIDLLHEIQEWEANRY